MITSLYIHIPFCRSKCLFCSFTIAVAAEKHINAYLNCLEKEAAHYRGSEVCTVYIGGGTPSLLENEQLERLVVIIKENFKFTPHAEFTLEANPATFDYAKAKRMYRLGINRISLGVQSLNDKYLTFLKRPHKAVDAQIAYGDLRQAGFDNINLDLMYSFPQQTLKDIENDVRAIAAFGSEHLSLYALTVEEGSRFYSQHIHLPGPARRAHHYARVAELLLAQGFEQYEISNFSKKGKQSRHNRIYWQGQNYIGLGVGAHSHKSGERFWNVTSLRLYMQLLAEGKMPVAGKEKLSSQEQFMETLLFGLRMNEGVIVEQLEKRFDCRLPGEKKDLMSQFITAGFLLEENHRLKTTLKGRLVLDELSARLI